LYGTYVDEESLAAESAVNNIVLSNAFNIPNTQKQASTIAHIDSVSLDLTVPPNTSASVAVQPPAPAPVTESLSTVITSSLSVNNLLKLMASFPTTSQVKDSSFDTMRQMMLATIPDDWLSTVYGVTRPILDPTLQAQAKQQDVQNFLQNKFGLGYAAKALSSVPEASSHATAQDWRKLDYYFMGKDTDNVIAKDPVFNKLNNILALYAYQEYAPGINDYVTDAVGTSKWSDLLYSTVTAPPYLNRLTTQLNDPLNSAEGYQTVNNLVMLFHLLSPPGSTAAVDFYNKVMNYLSSETTKYMSETAVDAATMTEYLHQFIVLVFGGGSSLDPQVTQKYQADFKALVCGRRDLTFLFLFLYLFFFFFSNCCLLHCYRLLNKVLKLQLMKLSQQLI
jgi:hypothetical protein